MLINKEVLTIKRLLSLAIIFLLCVGMIGNAFAAPVDEAGYASENEDADHFTHALRTVSVNPFVDIEHHWAKDCILSCYRAGLVNGVSGTKFDPNAPLTRGMFVTILGRMLKVDPLDWAVQTDNFIFSDVKGSDYFAPYVNWAVHNGITTGIAEATFGPRAVVTREQMAAFVARTALLTNNILSPIEDGYVFEGEFADQASISRFAVDYVATLKRIGIFNGMVTEDGAVNFCPRRAATRAEGCVVFERLSRALIPLDENRWVEPDRIVIQNPISSLEPYQNYMLHATIDPVFANNPTLIWASANPSVIRITPDGLMSWQHPGASMITVTACNGVTAQLFVRAEEPPQQSYAYNGESYVDKCNRIFGKYVDDPRLVYKTPAEAEAHLVSVSVSVWDIASDGSKYTKTAWLRVHENIAPTVKQIFNEIYCDASQPPIKTCGGYRFCASSASEHTPGLAIDINPDENYYCSPDGTPLTGKYFKPGEDPYSMPVDGVVETIFRKYGFTRGIYWRSGTKDYMHFSFFGT